MSIAWIMTMHFPLLLSISSRLWLFLSSILRILVSRGYICGLRATTWRLGDSQGRFWNDLGGHLGAIGGPGVTCGAILEPRMVHFGVFLVAFILDMFLVANCCQNCLKKVCPGTP